LVARSVPGLDAVLAGGEDWTGLDYGEGDVLRDVPIITAKAGLEDFAALELTMDPERLRVEKVEARRYGAADYADIVPDPAVYSAIASRMTVLTPLFGEILNVTPVTLRALDPMNPYTETELPRLVTDAYREKTGADAAFTYAAAMLKDIPAGSITYGQLIELGNPNNELLTLIVPGYVILDMLETSVDAMVRAGEAERITLEAAGLALERIYASGLTYMYDAQGVKGERVLDVRVGGRQLEPDGMYTIAVSENMRGLSSYMALNDAEVTGDFGKCADAIREYVIGFGVEGAVEAEPRAVRIE
jgi:2',3'-cyclic-nucleotide 2'-phosphodiesterase (5'-nucleotidase family)